MKIQYQNGLMRLGAETGLSMDNQTGTLFGEKNGYTILLTRLRRNGLFALSVAVCHGGELPDTKELKAAVKQSKALAGCTVQRYKAVYTVRGAKTKAAANANVIKALNDLTRFLRENGFQNCCQSCGQIGETDPYSLAGADAILCPTCFAERSHSVDFKAQEQSRRRENVVGGIVGAFLGSLIGVAMIVIIGQLGYVAALSGVVMGVCTIKGYELLGGRLSNRGIAISAVLMLLMVYAGNRIDWAVMIARELDAGIVESFQAVPYFYQEGALTGYIGSLLMVYGFTALGAVPTVFGRIRNRENENSARKLTAGI